MSSRSRHLVEFLTSLSQSDVSGDLERFAILSLLDNIGCGLYGARQEWGEIVNSFVLSEGSAGAATLYGEKKPVSPARAALANGTSTHGFEIDDTLYAQIHPGAVVVPAALAAAEHSGASGPRLLLAIVAGYEMTGRIMQALGPDPGHKGYHTTGVVGPIAATMAAGITMRLDAEQILSAIGNACSSSSGIKAFIQGTGGMSKRMHAGRAAESGVVACQLAQQGFTGPMGAIDGRFGLLEVIGGTGTNLGALDRDLGSSFAITQVSVKIYPSCGVTHTAIEGLESLKLAHKFAPEQIEEIRIHTSSRGVTQNGGRNPQDTMAAQYSLPFCAAVAATKNPRNPTAFAEANLQDRIVQAMADRTKLIVDEEMDRLYPSKLGARVEVRLVDGNHFQTTVLDPHGSSANPCSSDDIESKFKLLSAAAIGSAAVEPILAAVKELPSATSLKALSGALRGFG